MPPVNDNADGFLLPNEPTYIVAGSGAEVRIFLSTRRFGQWQAVRTLENPGAAIPDKERNTDKPGRAFDSFGKARHAMAPEETGRDHEMQQFAGNVARYLSKAMNTGSFRQLILIAEPTFLGYVRRKLSPSLKRALCREIPKNPADFDVQRLRGMLT